MEVYGIFLVFGPFGLKPGNDAELRKLFSPQTVWFIKGTVHFFQNLTVD